MKTNTTTIIKGSSSFDPIDGLNELIGWRLDAIQEAIQEENWEEAERLFPRIQGLGIEFLKISYLYDTIVKKIVIAGGGDHNDLALYTYSANIGDNMYDMLSENFELVLYIENKRIIPVLALCSNRGLLRKDIFNLEKEIEIENNKLFIQHERDSFFYKGTPSKVARVEKEAEDKPDWAI